MECFLNNIEQNLHKEEGFSTVGVALALLITLALILSAAQVYEIDSVSADIQEVADAAALAAENTVGEYCVIATLCDAIVLSLSLSSLCCLGLSVAAACTPVTAAAAETLFQAAQKLKQTHDSFSQRATNALEKLKELLPLIAAAKAANVIEKNSNTRSGASYKGIAMLVPWQTEALEDQSHEKSDHAFDTVTEKKDLIEELGAEAEQAAQRMNAIKEEAYRADSGSETSYCMYERAKKLAPQLSEYQNPFYTSSETWGFDVALDRAGAYYRIRAEYERPDGNSTETRARSALRRHFYDYAALTLEAGYVDDTEGAYEAYLPLLPKNIDEMKRTSLYIENRYPISKRADGKLAMHAFDSCPRYAQDEKAGKGSLKQLDNNTSFGTCPECQFTLESVGKIAAASTSIENGFEHYYRKVAELARDYTEARQAFEDSSQELKSRSQELFDTVERAFEEAKAGRIKIDPPGKFGAIAFVITSQPGTSSFLSQFVANRDDFSMRAALSGATLVPESTESGKTVINDLLGDYANTDANAITKPAQIVLDLWSGLLKGYSEGQASLIAELKSAIDKLPLASESGLGQWAANCFASGLSELGLEPIDLSPQKAVLVNTAHILRADDSNFSARLLSTKEKVLSYQDADELFASTIGEAKSAVTDAIEGAEFTIEIATIEIVQGSLEIPITITLPRSVKEAATGLVEQSFAALEGAIAKVAPSRRWQ